MSSGSVSRTDRGASAVKRTDGCRCHEDEDDELPAPNVLADSSGPVRKRRSGLSSMLRPRGQLVAHTRLIHTLDGHWSDPGSTPSPPPSTSPPHLSLPKLVQIKNPKPYNGQLVEFLCPPCQPRGGGGYPRSGTVAPPLPCPCLSPQTRLVKNPKPYNG